MNNYGYLNKDELYHHGVKGMKWGVRRYQNPDGTLTEAGKKRYYELDNTGLIYRLNKHGIKYNKKHSASYERYKNSVDTNVRKVNTKFNKEYEEYKKSRRDNNKHYLEERDKWFKGQKYKKADYYTFKDLAYSDWMNKGGKNEEKHRKALENIIRNAAKEHPLYEKTYSQLPSSFINSTYASPPKVEHIKMGEEAVDSIMSQLRFETINLYEKENKKN